MGVGDSFQAWRCRISAIGFLTERPARHSRDGMPHFFRGRGAGRLVPDSSTCLGVALEFCIGTFCSQPSTPLWPLVYSLSDASLPGMCTCMIDRLPDSHAHALSIATRWRGEDQMERRGPNAQRAAGVFPKPWERAIALGMIQPLVRGEPSTRHFVCRSRHHRCPVPDLPRLPHRQCF
jgi:hypothetical protein